MSFPLNISFKDREFEIVNSAAGKVPLREFVKSAAIKEAERIQKEKGA
jgi:hypothetical protein